MISYTEAHLEYSAIYSILEKIVEKAAEKIVEIPTVIVVGIPENGEVEDLTVFY